MAGDRPSGNRRKRWRYSLRAVFGVVFVVAAVTWWFSGFPVLFERYFASTVSRAHGPGEEARAFESVHRYASGYSVMLFDQANRVVDDHVPDWEESVVAVEIVFSHGVRCRRTVDSRSNVGILLGE